MWFVKHAPCTAPILRSKVSVPLMKASKICLLTQLSNQRQMNLLFQLDSITTPSQLPIIRAINRQYM